MALKKRGAWDRNEITRQSVFFANYCSNCRTKVYMTKEEAEEFFENSYIHFHKISLINNVKKIVAYRLPKISIKVEWGRGVKSVNNLNNRRGLDNKVALE